MTREVDLILHWISDFGSDIQTASLPVDVEFTAIVECKTSSHPWVVLRHAFDEDDDGSPLVDLRRSSIHWQHRQPSMSLDGFMEALASYLTPQLPARPLPGYAILDGLSKPGSREGGYDAVRQALSSVINVASTVFLGYSAANVSWFFPVVLTSARLFEASLDPKSDEMRVREVERTCVDVPYEGALQYPVTLLNSSALSSLIQDLETVPNIITEYFATAADERLVREVKNEDYMFTSYPEVIANRLH